MNEPTSSASVPPMPPELPRPHTRTPAVVTIVAIVVAVIAAGAVWYWQSLGGGMPSPTQMPTPDGGIETATPKPSVSDGLDPRLIDDLPVFKKELPEWNPGVDWARFYLIGTVTEPTYAGAQLIVADIDCEGPCFYPMRYRFLRTTSGAIILLQRYSEIVDQYSSLDPATFTTDTSFMLPGLETPDAITAPNGAVLEEDVMVRWWFDEQFSMDDLVPVFKDPALGQFYTDRQNDAPTPTPDPETGRIPEYRNIQNGFYARLADGSVAVYKLRLPTLQIIWDDGQSRWAEYESAARGGCGATNYAEVVPPYELDEERDLVKTGMTKNGEPILEYRDPQHEFLRQAYDMYAGVWLASEERYEKEPYEAFIAAKPILFWRDQFGRLLRLRNKANIPLAECGKPVIYLYPERTTAVDVRVEPVGGMSFSEPSYGEGWSVTAHPDGTLTDRNGASWPYLFWEGSGGIYETPDRGWVVKREEVGTFLDEKLALHGLNTHEAADFKEFWLPRMQDAPYYFVTFLGNRAMDALAPLTVEPRPDTVIRLLMDFTPLERPISVEPYTIRTPERTGFTVVEWGGVIR